MGMKVSLTRVCSLAVALPALVVLLALAGCGTAPGTVAGSSGSGADGGPWPQAPNRNTAQSPANAEAPTAPLLITLRATAPEEAELLLNLARVELKFGDRWLNVAGKADIEKIEKLPLRFGPKGGTALLATTRIPRQQYSHLRLSFADDKNALVREEETRRLAVPPAVLALGEWKMDDKVNNGLVIQVDGMKITRVDDRDTLPAAGFSVKTGVPAGGIKGNLLPPLPTATVEAFWGATDVRVAGAAPTAADGAFTLPNLPAGAYRLEVRAAGHHLIEPLKERVKVEQAVVTLAPLELAADAPAQ